MKIVSTNGDYKGFAHAKELYFEDCTLVGQFAYMGLKASFKNCQFIQESANAYNLQTYTADEYVLIIVHSRLQASSCIHIEKNNVFI